MPLKAAGRLQSYERLGPTQGKVSKSRTFVDAAALSGVGTVGIEPTRFSPGAAARVLKVEDRVLVANALDRRARVVWPCGAPRASIARRKSAMELAGYLRGDVEFGRHEMMASRICATINPKEEPRAAVGPAGLRALLGEPRRGALLSRLHDALDST